MLTSYDVIVSAQQTVARATMYPAPGSLRGIVLLSSSAGDPGDPSASFDELALYCQSAGVTVVRFRMRSPHLFVPTVIDLRATVGALRERGVERVVVVVEAASRRSAAFVPIAYRSVVGLVNAVVGVATILPFSNEQAQRLPRSLPADLVFLLRSARAHSDGPVAQRELTRANGLSELFLAPGAPRTRADALSAIVTPVYSWAQRTLAHRTSRDELARPESRRPAGPTEIELSADAIGEEIVPTLADAISKATSGRPIEELSGGYRAVWMWLTEEWRRILADQLARDPMRSLPEEIAPPAEMAGLSPHMLLRRFASLWIHLDRTCQVEWTSAYVHASRMVAEMTTIIAATPEMDYGACGA